jgi:hypothetical protein
MIEALSGLVIASVGAVVVIGVAYAAILLSIGAGGAVLNAAQEQTKKGKSIFDSWTVLIAFVLILSFIVVLGR